jgi:hypothetical protein
MYSFKVLASNIYGDGPYSPVFTFKASKEPEKLSNDFI